MRAVDTDVPVRYPTGDDPEQAARARAATLRSFAGLPGVSIEDPALLVEALARREEGMDFADALHLGAAG